MKTTEEKQAILGTWMVLGFILTTGLFSVIALLGVIALVFKSLFATVCFY